MSRAIFLLILLSSLFLQACKEDQPILVNTFSIDSALELDKPIKALFISDIHYREGQLVFDNIIKIARKAKPDLIFLGGDYTGMGVLKTDFLRGFMVDELSKLAQLAPTYAVLGNHEYYTDPYKWTQNLLSSPLRLLDGQTEIYAIRGISICIRGLDDAYTGHYQHIPFSPECAGLKLTITHDPYAIELDPEDGLYLAGHTHCGQFKLPFIEPFWIPTDASSDYWCGYGWKDHKKWITSAGVGNSVINLRINTAASIELINIH